MVRRFQHLLPAVPEEKDDDDHAQHFGKRAGNGRNIVGAK